jgi:hypothetical protein
MSGTRPMKKIDEPNHDGLQFNHDGLQFAKPNLQSVFKKPGDGAPEL